MYEGQIKASIPLGQETEIDGVKLRIIDLGVTIAQATGNSGDRYFYFHSKGSEWRCNISDSLDQALTLKGFKWHWNQIRNNCEIVKERKGVIVSGIPPCGHVSGFNEYLIYAAIRFALEVEQEFQESEGDRND